MGNDFFRNMLNDHCRKVDPNWLAIAEPKVRLSSIHHTFWHSFNLYFVAKNMRASRLPDIWVFCSSNVRIHTIVKNTDQFVLDAECNSFK